MADSTLQNINSLIRLAAITLRKWPLCPPTDKKNWSKTTFLELLHQNYLSATPNDFQRQSIFIKEAIGQKSTISEKKSKITKKCQKSWLFKKIWLLWLLISLHFYTCPTVHEYCPYMRQRNITTENCIFGDFFRKSHHRTPPNLAKTQWRRNSTQKCQKEKSRR